MKCFRCLDEIKDDKYYYVTLTVYENGERSGHVFRSSNKMCKSCTLRLEEIYGDG